MSAATLRLSGELQAEANAYAERLGISFNALCAVALRDYLDARLAAASLQQGAAALPPTRLTGTKAMRALAAATPSASRTQSAVTSPSTVVPKVGANAPCPCGSGEKYKRCHGKPGT